MIGCGVTPDEVFMNLYDSSFHGNLPMLQCLMNGVDSTAGILIRQPLLIQNAVRRGHCAMLEWMLNEVSVTGLDAGATLTTAVRKEEKFGDVLEMVRKL